MIFIRQMTKELLDDGRVKFWKHEKKNDHWRQVDFRTVQDKVSHALRDSKGCSDSGVDLMMDYTKVTNPVQQPLEPRAESLQLYHDMKQQQVEAQTLGHPQSTSSVLPQIDVATLEPTLRASMQHLQELNQQNIEDQRELVAAAIQERQHNATLLSMANKFSTPPATLSMNPGSGQPLLSQLGGLGQLGFQSRLGPNAPPPSLFENSRQRSLDSIINQSNTRSQQLTADDMLLHRIRHHSSGGLGQLMNTPNTVSAALGGNAAVGAPFQNQRVHGTNRLRKNLDAPIAPGGGVDMLARQNYMERSLQKLKLQRMAELKIVEEHLRKSQN